MKKSQIELNDVSLENDSAKKENLEAILARVKKKSTPLSYDKETSHDKDGGFDKSHERDHDKAFD